MNKLIRLILLVFIIFFLALYLGRYLDTYIQSNNTLTDEAIIRFEQDLKAGKKINTTDYLPKEKNYNNRASKIGMKTSKIIEKSFKSVLKYFLGYLEDY